MKVCDLKNKMNFEMSNFFDNSGPSTLRLLVSRILPHMRPIGFTSELPPSLTSSISEGRLESQPWDLTTVASRETVSALPSTNRELEKWSDTASSNSKKLVSLATSSTNLRTAASNPLERPWQGKAPLTWTESPLNSWRRRRRPRSEHAPLPLARSRLRPLGLSPHFL